jgi:hypothetical protein
MTLGVLTCRLAYEVGAPWHGHRMSDEPWTRIPGSWRPATPDLVEHAVAAALQALATDSPRPAQRRLTNFYDRSRDFAGATFVNLVPVVPDDITAADLHATTLLSVEIRPGATRRLLDNSSTRTRVLDALAAVPHKNLQFADPADLSVMEVLYGAVKDALSDPSTANPNAWVTASKLCARKRPALFPVRDNIVCTHLGLLSEGKRGDYQVDWQVFRALINDRRVVDAIGALGPLVETAARDRQVQTDTGPLRLLDAALWTWASGKG